MPRNGKEPSVCACVVLQPKRLQHVTKQYHLSWGLLVSARRYCFVFVLFVYCLWLVSKIEIEMAVTDWLQVCAEFTVRVRVLCLWRIVLETLEWNEATFEQCVDAEEEMKIFQFRCTGVVMRKAECRAQWYIRVVSFFLGGLCPEMAGQGAETTGQPCEYTMACTDVSSRTPFY